MKILTICQYYYPEQFRINDICEALVEEGNEVTVLTGLPNYPKGKIPKEYKFFRKRKEYVNGVNIIRCFEIGRRTGVLFRILNYLSYPISASIKILFMKEKFDVVFVNQLSPILMAIPGIIYKKIHKTKLVIYCLDLWPDSVKTFGVKEKSLIYKITDKISKKIYKQADKILVTSKSFIRELENGNIIEYLPQYAEEGFKRKDFNENNECNFIFAGNIGKAQSVETIIKAASEVKNEKIQIHIVGEGSSLENVKVLSKNLNNKNVIFQGKKKLEEMQEYYNMADAMLVTLSKDEFAGKTLPGKVQVCMATANPIIAAANGETKKLIDEAKCGFCVQSEDYLELAKAMDNFCNMNSKEKEIMGNNGFEFYKKNFEKKSIIKKLIDELKAEV